MNRQEQQSLQTLFSLMQSLVYMLMIFEFIIMVSKRHFDSITPHIQKMVVKTHNLWVYEDVWNSKISLLILIVITSIGTKAKKDINFNFIKMVVVPLVFGLVAYFASTQFYLLPGQTQWLEYLTTNDLIYIGLSIFGAVIIHSSLDNISKAVKSSFMKDRFNLENQSFEQNTVRSPSKSAINYHMSFHNKRKTRKGIFSIENIYRGTLVIGVPASGKSFSIINPFIIEMINRGSAILLYDIKSPEQTELAYYHYLKNEKTDKRTFHVINPNKLEYSRRVNPIHPRYLENSNTIMQVAELMFDGLRKVDKSKGGGSDQFFSQSATNFLYALITCLRKFKNGRYCTIPHVITLATQPYADVIAVTMLYPELQAVMQPFISALKEAPKQLEGMVGTLRVNASKIANPETFWTFSAEDISLDLNDPEHPKILVLQSSIATVDSTSAMYSTLINTITRTLNQPNKHPSAIIIDEAPTVYLHRINQLIATARSNKVAVLLGIQTLKQLLELYGKTAAETVQSTIGNIIAGNTQDSQTINWLQTIFGKVKQQKTSVNINSDQTSISTSEQMDWLIPASAIAGLATGEIAAKVAPDQAGRSAELSTYKCKISIDVSKVEKEEKKYVPTPKYYDFGSEKQKEQAIHQNMLKIQTEVINIVAYHKRLLTKTNKS